MESSERRGSEQPCLISEMVCLSNDTDLDDTDLWFPYFRAEKRSFPRETSGMGCIWTVIPWEMIVTSLNHR